MKEAQNEAQLQRLIKLLTVRALTALQIARRMRCTPPTAYSRLRALKKRGYKVASSRVRVNPKGPKSRVYSIALDGA